MPLPGVAARTIAILVFAIALLLALMGSLFAACTLARLTPHIAALTAAALIVCFLITFAAAKFVAKLWPIQQRRVPLLLSAVITASFALALSLSVFRPMPFPHVEPIARANTQYWSLPSGSHIAYSLYAPPQGVPVKPDPIVYLHGGPGFRAADFDHELYSQFAKDGFNVYLFDQAGSGLSDRLPQATGYTVERFVTDLEQIRQQIGADKLILIGHSWGGELAAHYAATYPQHVARLVFHSPGPLWSVPFVPFEQRRTNLPPAPLPPARAMAALALSYANPAASENLVSQSELGDWMYASADPRELVCKGQPLGQAQRFAGQTIAGLNMYPILTTVQELKQPAMDVRPQLATLHIPAIALYAQCDFIPWPSHSQYRKAIPGLQEFYFPNAGHFIHLQQPDKLIAVIRAFLLDQSPPLPAYTGENDPRPSMPSPSQH